MADPANSDQSSNQANQSDPAAPGDGSMVPRERLNEVIDERDRLASENVRLSQEQANAGAGGSEHAAPNQPPQRYTRAQLTQFVEDGRITDDQKEDIWATQQQQITAEAATNAAAAVVNTASRQSAVEGEIQRYIAAVPAMSKAGSEQHQRLQNEYNFLLSVGDKKEDVATTLKAMRTAFGPINAVEAAAPRSRDAESHQEINSGGGDGGDAPGADGGSAPKGMPRDQVDHYDRMIKQGVYQNWGQINEERKFANMYNPNKPTGAV